MGRETVPEEPNVMTFIGGPLNGARVANASSSRLYLVVKQTVPKKFNADDQLRNYEPLNLTEGYYTRVAETLVAGDDAKMHGKMQPVAIMVWIGWSA